MDLGLKDKIVLITGGSKGLGFACAQAFIAEGAHVIIVARDATRLASAVERLGGKAESHAVDLTDADAALSIVNEIELQGGPVDILINSAGAALRTPFGELTPQAWTDAMQAKFFTYINVMDPLIKRMGSRGSGAIVNIVGMGGKIATPTHLAGGAANAALMLASAGLANAYGPKGVRVNVINPALTFTERMAQGIAADARLQQVSEEEILIQAKARLPLGRIASPEDIANAVVFLSSSRAGYISGAILSMDGATVPIVV